MTQPEQRRPRRVPPAVREAEARRQQQPREAEGRRWRPSISFRTFFAFSAGVFLMGLWSDVPVLGQALFYVGIVGTAYGLARLVVRGAGRS